MTVTTEPEFYDVAMADPDAPAMLPVGDSPWLPLYREASAWIPPSHAVVDLGCGTGRFLRLLADRDHYGPLEGVDFSPAAISAAWAYLPDRVAVSVGDLRDWRPAPQRPGNTTYVCLEVLEHLDDDRELVWRVPPGHELIFSVPNYESEAHQRTFQSVGEIFHRYDSWLLYRRWSLVELGDGKAIHLVDATRRLESW